ncbi:MAG: adenylate/guanylate cyclase domain-containing protein, partial [Pseudomonadota bacterium]
AQFGECSSALDAAFAINRTLQESPVSLTDEENFRVCIGIGYGEVLNAGHEGCFGNEVNVASKLGEDTADPGEILLTESAYNALSDEQRAHFSARKIDVSGVAIAYFHTHCR